MTILAEHEKKDIPSDIRKKLEDGRAFFPSELASEDFQQYLAALDEKIFEEIYVRVGMNGTSRLLLVAVETSDQERKRLNFPLFKKKLGYKDFKNRIGS